jgi:hypothetical protein
VQVRTLEIESSNIDLKRYTVAWYLHDDLLSQERGNTRQEITLGMVGEMNLIEAFSTGPDGRRYAISQEFVSADIDLLIEPLTYVPPFFRGLALPSAQSFVRITAVPHIINTRGQRVSPSDIDFDWAVEGVVLGSQSGVGKNSVVIQAAILPYSEVSVFVSATYQQNSITVSKSKSIETVEPLSMVYERKPLLGTQYQRLLQTSFQPEGDEFTLIGEPYYFSLDDMQDSALRHRWKINGNTIQENIDMEPVVFRNEEAEGGSVRISYEIENFNKLLQLVRSMLRVDFN